MVGGITRATVGDSRKRALVETRKTILLVPKAPEHPAPDCLLEGSGLRLLVHVGDFTSTRSSLIGQVREALKLPYNGSPGLWRKARISACRTALSSETGWSGESRRRRWQTWLQQPTHRRFANSTSSNKNGLFGRDNLTQLCQNKTAFQSTKSPSGRTGRPSVVSPGCRFVRLLPTIHPG
jgi:hypothetical protein